MPLFERDKSKQMGSPADSPHNASAAPGPNASAEDSAAHIAELVRRTAERNAARSAPVARTEATTVQPQDPMPVTPASPAALPAPDPPVPPMPPAPPVASRTTARPGTPPRRPAIRRPPMRVLLAGGAVAAVSIAGAFTLSGSPSSQAGRTSPTQIQATAAQAPPGYSVKVTDVITDCENHSYGRMKRSFTARNCVRAQRTLATGQVSGRPTLFVMSRITMASVEAAAAVKQTLDANGTGNLNDLLREGRTFPGAPAKMPSSGYASVQMGTVILVAEAGFADEGPSSNTDPTLRAAAAQVAALNATAR